MRERSTESGVFESRQCCTAPHVLSSMLSRRPGTGTGDRYARHRRNSGKEGDDKASSPPQYRLNQKADQTRRSGKCFECFSPRTKHNKKYVHIPSYVQLSVKRRTRPPSYSSRSFPSYSCGVVHDQLADCVQMGDGRRNGRIVLESRHCRSRCQESTMECTVKAS